MSRADRNERITELTARLHAARDTLADCRKKAPLLAERFRKVVKAIDDNQIPLAAVLVKECPPISELEKAIIGIEDAEQEIALCDQDIERLLKTPIE